MGDLKIKNFEHGLDTRRSVLETEIGALIELENAQINQGGEIEKRKKFLRQALPTGTFGLQSIGDSLVTFGSDDPASTITAALAAITAFSIAYKRCQHPAIIDGLVTYSAGSHAMTAITHSTVFGVKTFAIALFADGQTFAYYDGNIVRDFFAGNILSYLANNNILLAKNIVTLINEQGDYTATQLTFATTFRSRTANVATLTFASTTGLVVGQSIQITGFTAGNTAYNTTLATLTGVTATQVTYANTGSNEGNTADVTGILTSCLIKVAGTAGADFGVITTETSAAGSFGVATTTQAMVAGTPGNSAVASFKITGGRVGGAATAVLTGTGTNPAAGGTVTIGTKVYTLVAAITNTEGQVLIAATSNGTWQNLIDAINHGNGAGVNYYCEAANTDVAAGPLNTGTHVFTVEALIGGTAGNSIAKAETATNCSWDAGTFLSGGTASAGVNVISQIEVVSLVGVRVSLLASPVEFVGSIADTCAAVVAAINAYTDTSHYTAVVTNVNEISLYSLTTANPQPTNYNVVVTAKGNVCIGSCYFYFTPSNFSAFTVSQLTVNGTNILGGAISMSTLSPSDLTTVYKTMETQINAASVTHGMNACAHVGHLQLSKRITSSTDQSVAVFAVLVNGITTFTDSNPSIPPSLDNTLSITLASSGETIFYGGAAANPSAIGVGGVPPYTFRWGSAYEQTQLQPNETLPPFTNGVFAYSNPAHYLQFLVLVYKLTDGATNLATTSFGQTWANSKLFSNYTAAYPLVWQCEVTDSVGNKAAKIYTLTVIY